MHDIPAEDGKIGNLFHSVLFTYHFSKPNFLPALYSILVHSGIRATTHLSGETFIVLETYTFFSLEKHWHIGDTYLHVLVWRNFWHTEDT